MRIGVVAAILVLAAAAITPARHLIHWSASGSRTGMDQVAGTSLASGIGHGPLMSSPAPSATPSPSRTPVPRPAAPKPTPARSTPASASGAVYRNPLRDVSGLILERVDMGVDFGGAGPVYALGDGVITNATSDSSGWPGGGWITYQLTNGPGAGLEVYVAEDVTPTVSVGQRVTSSTQVATMFNGGDGIETGWAQPGGASAESQLPAAGGISGNGPFPTEVGLNFEQLLEALGVAPAPNSGEPGNGLLPSGYPTNWASAR